MAFDLVNHTGRLDAYTDPPLAPRVFRGLRVAATLCHAVPYGTDLLEIPFQALRARLRSLSPYGTRLPP
ncbi:MAG TPA: hypothetical protein VE860_01035 [Chthoniobacterales bacterium]|nr:hypothetical protein [Chthoniobacterales bacterium]